MSKPWFANLARVALALVMILLVGCAKSATPTPAPTRTPKPTFTPGAQAQAPTQAQAATEAPATLAPTLTPASGQATAAQPTSAATPDSPIEASSPEATEAPKATATTVMPAAKSLKMNSPEYGMQAFLWWRPEVGSRDLQAVRNAGFTWVKVNFGWRDIEGAAKGAFDWSHTDWIVTTANHDGIDLVVRIDHQPAWTGGGYPTNGPPDNLQDLNDFVSAMATRYKGRIRAYEIWNEPNLAREWGGKLPDPGQYAKMLKGAYGAIKAADPNAMVMSAGLSPTGTWNEEARPDEWYLKSLYIAMGGSSNGHFDVLAAHAPGFNYPPEADPAEVAAKEAHGQRAFCFRHVEDLRKIMVENGDAGKQIAILEFGWTSDPRADSPYHWHAVSEQTKADYLVRAYQYAKKNWSPWIGLMSLIYVADHEWTEANEQYWWAITEPGYPELKARPAYEALKAMPK